MELELLRYAGGKDDTLGLFLIDCQFYTYTLEDEQRTKKVFGETRIPAGRYEIKLRTVGGFHNRYKAKFGDWHKGMLHITDVPNFEYILIHIGNDDDDTAGCVLVGYKTNYNLGRQKGYIGNSTSAYKSIYPIISKALLDEEKVFITVKDGLHS